MKRFLILTNVAILFIVIDLAVHACMFVVTSQNAVESSADGEWPLTLFGLPLMTSFRRAGRIGMEVHPGIVVTIVVPIVLLFAIFAIVVFVRYRSQRETRPGSDHKG